MEVSGLPTLQRAAGMVLLSMAILVLIATCRLLLDGQRHMQEARRFLSLGDRDIAVNELEDAAKAYFPGSPYPRRALRELAIMAKAAEMRGDPVKGTQIWRASRRAIIATRHFVQPHRGELHRIEREIVRLNTGMGARDTKRKPFESDPVKGPRDPDPTMSFLLFFGLLCWIGGAIALCLVPRDREPGINRARKSAWIASFGGLTLWLIMSWLA